MFDWVRKLPEDNPLQKLCDSNTYTTMIALCGSWQQVRRALSLVADMRARNLDSGIQVTPPPPSPPSPSPCHLPSGPPGCSSLLIVDLLHRYSRVCTRSVVDLLVHRRIREAGWLALESSLECH